MRAEVCLLTTLCVGCDGVSTLEGDPAHDVDQAGVLDQGDTVYDGLLIEVTPLTFRLDGEPVQTALQLELMEVDAPLELVLLAIEPTVIGRRIVATLDTLRAVEVPQVRFLDDGRELDLMLTQDAEPFEVGADAPWSDIGPLWQPRSGESATWVLAGSDPTRGKRSRRPTRRSTPPEEDEEPANGLDQDAVSAVLSRYRGAFRGCYEQAKLRSPSVSGRAVLRITVGAEGRVTAASLSTDTLGDAALSTCLVGVARRMTFPIPDPGDDPVVTFPLVFSP